MSSGGSEPVTGPADFLVDGTTGPLTEGEKSSRDVLEISSEHYRARDPLVWHRPQS